jgi:hypothetical protein
MGVLSLLSDLMDAQVIQMKLRPNEEKKLILSERLFNQLVKEINDLSNNPLDETLDLYYQNILVEKFGSGGEEIVYASIQLK